jgi:hypothetical protein
LDVKTIVPMPTSRFTGNHVRATGSDEPVTLRWCNPGLIVYKAVREQDRDLFLCTARDQGKIDAFLKPKLYRGIDIVDEYINRTVGPKIEAAISSMPLGTVLEKIIKNPAGRKLLEKARPGSSVILDQLDVKTLGDLAEEAVGTLGPAIRNVAMEFKRRLMDQVRSYLHDQMMTMLQQELNALCATVTVLTMEELLKKFRDNLPKYFGEAVGVLAPALAAQMATELLAEAAEGVLTVIAVACGIVFVVAAALELGAAALIAAAVDAVEVAIAAVIRAVAAAFASGGLTPLLGSNTDDQGAGGPAKPPGQTAAPSAQV